MSETSVRDAVIDVVVEVARQHRPDIATSQLGDSLSRDLGLDSLDFAQIVAELEIRLGIDPFAHQVASRIATVGDLVTAYERAATDR